MKKQISFKYAPFLRLLLPFITGICISYYLKISFAPSGIIIFVSLLVILFLASAPLVFRLSKKISGLCIAFAVMLAGMMVTNQSLQHSVLPDVKYNYTGIVMTNPVCGEKSSRIECQLTDHWCNNLSGKLSEQIMIYYNEKGLTDKPSIGDSVSFTAIIKMFELKANPGQFNYAKYLADRGIIYTVYLKHPNLKFGGNSKKFAIKRFAGRIQKSIKESFKKYSIKDDELAVLTALFAGDRTLIDEDIMQSYVASGAVHILSVSGMHVGILFMFLSILIGNRKRNRGVMVFRLVIIVATIWFYAFITGLSPSVTRASVMFTLFTIGKSFERQINTYNILASSAMLILFFDPLILFQVGFQLSYLAVIGIVYFQPRISKLLIFRLRLADWIWQLTTVGIAAQLATFPLTLYYFHQFPVYFWVTNILVIPLVWLIMTGTMLFFIAIPFSALAGLISVLVNYIVLFMNFLINNIGKLPGSVISDIRFGFAELIASALICIVSLTIYYHGSKKHLNHFIIISLICYIGFSLIKYNIDSKKQDVLVYNVKNGIVISIIDGHKHLVLANSEILSNFSLNCRSMNNFWIQRQIKKDMIVINVDSLSKHSNLRTSIANVSPNNAGLLMQAGRYCYFIPTFSFAKENVLQTKDENEKLYIKPFADIKGIENVAQKKVQGIIITGSLPYLQKRKWKSESENMNLTFYDTAIEGPFYINSSVD